MNTDYSRFERHADDPHHPYGFRGTWQIGDHSLIPSCLHEFLMLSFGVAHLKKIDLDTINDLLNREWDAQHPSPYNRIWDLVVQLRSSGRDIKFERSAPVNYDADDHNLPVFSWDSYEETGHTEEPL